LVEGTLVSEAGKINFPGSMGSEIFSIILKEQVSLIFWAIRHLDAFYSSEFAWLSGSNEKDNSNFGEGPSRGLAGPKINSGSR
jgi:hypothetical protein